MFGLFYKIRTGRKGQLSALLTVLLVAFLIFAFLTVNLGKIGLQRSRLSNAADSAALAAGSVASQLLNYMAGYNETMLINFSGFVSTIMFLIVQFILDLVEVFMWVAATFVEALVVLGGGEEGFASTNAKWALGSLELTALTMKLVFDGATKVGKALEKRIRELNDKLPKNTRNTARQYAFQNAGIDEPKIAYDDWLEKTGRSDSDSSWKEYLKLETGFDAFMRTLADTNETNTNNTLSFKWTDQRQGQIVNNTVEVITAPMQPLSLETKNFKDVAFDPVLQIEIVMVINKLISSWWLSAIVIIAIFMSTLIYTFLAVIIALMTVLKIIITILVAIVAILLVVYGICCVVAGALCALTGASCDTARRCCKAVARLLALSAKVALWVGLVGSIAYTISAIKLSDVQCLVYGRGDNDLTVSTEIKRRTERAVGGALDYGFWRMQYPVVSSYSRVGVEGTGGGRLFPPVQGYEPKIIQTK